MGASKNIVHNQIEMKKYLGQLLLFSVLSTTVTFSQDSDESLVRLLDFVHNTRDYKEGYTENLGKNDFRYHSIRTDVEECLLTRATDGTMSIEWATESVDSEIKSKGIGFLWIAAMDITGVRCGFDLYLNDKKRFHIEASTSYSWSMESPDGGSLQFSSMEKDHHGDSHGYMALWAPTSWLNPGEPQRIRIVGEAAGSNSWIIVYKAKDAASYLQQSVQYDKWLKLDAVKIEKKYRLSLTLPAYFAGETLYYTSAGKSGKVLTKLRKKEAEAEFELPEKSFGEPLTIKDTNAEIVAINSFGHVESSSKLLNKAILKTSQAILEDGNININSQRIYSPKTVQSLKALSQSKLSDGKIYLMNSSHQDIAWMDSPEKCVLERDTMLLSPLFDLASLDPDYRFDIEDALMLKEFIHRHPDKKSLVQQMLSDGRISCGSTFIQPYEEMYSGESLARQFYFGAKWLKDEFNYDANIYWNVDVPGRTLQMPQIMKKAGTDYLMMSRFEKGAYNWYSPDGSYITTYSPGHYADAFRPLQKNFFDAAQYLSSSALFWEKYYKEKSENSVVPVLSDWDMSPAVNYSPFIKKWESVTEIQNENGDFEKVILPEFKIASGPEYFKALSAGINELPEIEGERPAIWLYIHGPSHQKALKASREGDIILTQAEKFATINAWIDGNFKNYPQNALNSAWEAKIYPDHGWGGKNGHITDNLFLQKFVEAKSSGEKILDQTLMDISSKIKTSPEKGIPVVVFNSLSWVRSDVVSITLSFNPGEAKYVILTDAHGSDIPLQITEEEQYADGSLRSASICFIAEDLPSMGYKTYYYSSVKDKDSQQQMIGGSLENKFYKIEFTDGGLQSIYDKDLQKELIDPSKFKGGEVFTMRSIGNGAGEFSEVQQPDMEGFDKTGNYQMHWDLADNGPVFTSWKMRQAIKYAVVEQEVILYHELKRIDFKTKILNWEGVLFREFRFAMPLNMNEGQVAYEVPYGVLEVGKDEMKGDAGERYTIPCKDTRPRAIQNWISAFNESHSVMLSSTVVAADYLDPTNDPVSNVILQPILFASRQSCHGEGNDYLQTGDHSFLFTLTSANADWKSSYKSGIQANEKLHTVVDPKQYLNAELLEELSFVSLDADNVLIATMKKAENSQNTVIRMVEMEGEDTFSKMNLLPPVNTMEKVSLIEEPIKDSGTSKDLKLDIGHHAIETYMLEMD
jgi:alpha-mannosidase